MRELILGGTAVLIFLLGYGIATKIDDFFQIIHEHSSQPTDRKKLCIAYEHPEDRAAMQMVFNELVLDQAKVSFRFVYGTSGEIVEKMKTGTIDIACLDAGYGKKEEQNLKIRNIHLSKEPVSFEKSDGMLEPLSDEQVERKLVWRKNEQSVTNGIVREILFLCA